MNTFYPQTVISEIVHFQNNAFKKACLKILKKINPSEASVVNKDLPETYKYFKELSVKLQTHIKDQTEQLDVQSQALFLAYLKLIKIEVDHLCSTERLDIILNTIKANPSDKNTTCEDFVDEESGAVITVSRRNGITQYEGAYHYSFCKHVYFKIAVSPLRELLNKYEIFFDENFLLDRKQEIVSSLFVPITKNDNFKSKAEIFENKIIWDIDVKGFESFFSNHIETGTITLISGDSDKDKITKILKKVFEVGSYGGNKKNKKNTPSAKTEGFLLTENLIWHESAPTFAESFAPLICFDSKSKKVTPETTLFISFRKSGSRNPIVKILYKLFYIKNQKHNNRIRYSTLESAFKQYNSGGQ